MLAMTGAQGAASVQPAGHGAPAVQLTYILVIIYIFSMSVVLSMTLNCSSSSHY